jgi:hypothetical protein
MSSNTRPISPTRFASALAELPVGSLYAKAAELRNSLTHLKSSNEQLLPFSQEGDKDCADAIKENEETMERMQDRVLLLQQEVEVNRGMKWEPEGVQPKEPGEEEEEEVVTTNSSTGTTHNGGLSDEELRRRIEERMNEDGDQDGSGGVFL